jgi:hypothetical protein
VDELPEDILNPPMISLKGMYSFKPFVTLQSFTYSDIELVFRMCQRKYKQELYDMEHGKSVVDYTSYQEETKEEHIVESQNIDEIRISKEDKKKK